MEVRLYSHKRGKLTVGILKHAGEIKGKIPEVLFGTLNVANAPTAVSSHPLLTSMFHFYLMQVKKVVKKVFKGWRKKRGLDNLRNDNFAYHLRRRRFVSKLICEGIVGGSCAG